MQQLSICQDNILTADGGLMEVWNVWTPLIPPCHPWSTRHGRLARHRRRHTFIHIHLGAVSNCKECHQPTDGILVFQKHRGNMNCRRAIVWWWMLHQGRHPEPLARHPLLSGKFRKGRVWRIIDCQVGGAGRPRAKMRTSWGILAKLTRWWQDDGRMQGSFVIM